MTKGKMVYLSVEQLDYLRISQKERLEYIRQPKIAYEEVNGVSGVSEAILDEIHLLKQLIEKFNF